MGIRDRGASEDGSEEQTESGGVAVVEDFHGVPDRDQALDLVATHDEDGRELSDGQREGIAEQIQNAAAGHMVWRRSLAIEDQLAFAGVPSVFAPAADDAGE